MSIQPTPDGRISAKQIADHCSRPMQSAESARPRAQQCPYEPAVWILPSPDLIARCRARGRAPCAKGLSDLLGEHVAKHRIPELRLEPGALGRHDAPGIGNGQQFVDARWKHR